MSSAMKPVLAGAAPPPGAQGSPAKGNIAAVNHATAAHPQSAQNNHAPSTNFVGQNLTHHQPNAAPSAAHAVPSLAPVSQNMLQMAQNMSHHGNLSHHNQNSNNVSVPIPATVASIKTTPLSLISEKAAVSQPLALTRTPEKKDADTAAVQSNGTIESPKVAQSVPSNLKPQNDTAEKPLPETAMTPKLAEKPVLPAPSTPTKTETNSKITSKETDKNPSLSQPPLINKTVSTEKPKSNDIKESPAPQPPITPIKEAAKTIQEKAEPSPSKQEVKDTKPPHTPKKEEIPKVEPPKEPKGETAKEPKGETAKETKGETAKETKEETAKETKEETAKETKGETPKEPKGETPKEPQPEVKSTTKVESVEKQPAVVKPGTPAETKKSPKKEEPVKIPEPVPAQPKPSPKKQETKPPIKSTIKLATVTPAARKRRIEEKSPVVAEASPSKKQAPEHEANQTTPSTPESRLSKRNRTQVQLYQSPTPELLLATKLSASERRSTPTKSNEDKLIVIYKNEYLALRNAEGSFYVCQALQNVYRSTRKIKIRWLSQDKAIDPSGETYKPDFYDVTDMECVLTTLSLSRSSAGGGAQVLSATEEARVRSILQRALNVEQTGEKPQNLQLTPEHPDGLDLSLFTDESQLKKKKTKKRKRNSSKSSAHDKSDAADDKPDEAKPTPSKRARASSRKSPKSKPTPELTPQSINKRKAAGSTPVVAPASKVGIVRRIYKHTATVKASPVKVSPAKITIKPVTRSPAKKPTPTKKPEPKKPEPKKIEVKKVEPKKVEKVEPSPVKTPRGKTPRKLEKETKPSPIIPTPSTSTGKTTRTPRKPPSKK